jgi:phosphatidylserine/phosphatidylglycerophosphate/cardiolipin synthase-like enzyme
MAKFLNTSGLTYHLEELIKNANEKLVLISPYLKFNEKAKELLEDKNRMKIDIRIVYGKNELSPSELKWLRTLEYVRVSFNKNLHAKCYLSESESIVSSLNLYEFSQVNNNEMGILILRDDDVSLYKDNLEEVQRIIRISDEIKFDLETIEKKDDFTINTKEEPVDTNVEEKISTHKLAKNLKITTEKCIEGLIKKGYLKNSSKGNQLTEAGINAGGEFKISRYGGYYLWPSK